MMELRDLLLRTVVRPAWVAGGPKVETWTCSACGQDVERVSPAWKGIWFAATPGEVVALCARTHRTHDRTGAPLPVEEDADGEGGVPIVAVDESDDGAPPRSFVALVPPAGVACVLDGDAYELRRLAELRPGDLVGPGAAARLDGEVIGRVRVEDLDLDLDLRAIRLR